MKFVRATSDDVQVADESNRTGRCVKGFLLGIGIFIVVVSIVFLILLLSSAFPTLPRATRLQYAEICLQSANLMLTIAAIAVHPKRFRTLVLLCQYLRSPTESVGTSLQEIFSGLSLELHHQEYPTGVNTPLRKVLYLSILLNGQCFFYYPATLILWLVPDHYRPYSVVIIFLGLALSCCIGAVALEKRLLGHTNRFRARRAESAFEKYLVEDTSI